MVNLRCAVQKADKAMQSAAELRRGCRRSAGVEDGDGVAPDGTTQAQLRRRKTLPHVAVRFKALQEAKTPPRRVDDFGGVQERGKYNPY